MDELNRTFQKINHVCGAGNAGLIYLVASGMKPGGELRLGQLENKQYAKARTLLESLGLDTYINRMDIVEPFKTSERKGELETWAKHNGFDYKIARKENSDVIELKKLPIQLLFKNKNNQHDFEDAAKAYNKGDKSFGLFAGYPICCISSIQDYVSTERHFSQLRERLNSKGIAGIEHLVGIHHLPHSLDCKETKKLGYSQFLKETAPMIYATELYSLVKNASELMHYNPQLRTMKVSEI
ncbi:MAG: hypothetical protein Q8O89_03445 [Nanoarchaeota archaeon]|nr:hypothetical protein [Nanoarchaeota archaeon]